MEKVSIGTSVFVFPMPVVLVGTLAQGKANFMTVGWVSRVNASPPMIAVALGKHHYTVPFIVENGTFSVCVPSADMREKTDYCGLVTGEKTDKSKLFDVFYGSLQTAPMIKECPLCIECRLVKAVELPTNDVFIGEITASYADEGCLSDGKPDFKKVDPLLLTMPDNGYWALGERAGKAWSDGKKLMSNAGK
ncbi:MAG: FMN reductase (NADH) RutF [Methanocella sp. PtaU1.Bin125]|nr:MAG: FMN reductase (NADH) RutF [Methanocella sp. PtaU1.Bin125]